MSQEKLKSKYVGVSAVKDINRRYKWKFGFTYNKKKTESLFPYTPEGERSAAIAYDKARIKVGLDPVNILKRVKKE